MGDVISLDQLKAIEAEIEALKALLADIEKDQYYDTELLPVSNYTVRNNYSGGGGLYLNVVDVTGKGKLKYALVESFGDGNTARIKITIDGKGFFCDSAVTPRCYPGGVMSLKSLMGNDGESYVLNNFSALNIYTQGNIIYQTPKVSFLSKNNLYDADDSDFESKSHSNIYLIDKPIVFNSSLKIQVKPVGPSSSVPYYACSYDLFQ